MNAFIILSLKAQVIGNTVSHGSHFSIGKAEEKVFSTKKLLFVKRT